MGLVAFKAPWLPWVLVAFNVVLNGHWPKDELCGIAVGHSESIQRRYICDVVLTESSLVLLQRHLPVNTPRSPADGPAPMVDSAI